MSRPQVRRRSCLGSATIRVCLAGIACLSVGCRQVPPPTLSTSTVVARSAEPERAEESPATLPETARVPSSRPAPVDRRFRWNHSGFPRLARGDGVLASEGAESYFGVEVPSDQAPVLNLPPHLEGPSILEPEPRGFAEDEPLFGETDEPFTELPDCSDDCWDWSEPEFTWRDDWDELIPMLCEDACSVVTWKNALILGAAAGAAVAIREDLDGDVRSYFARHPETWGDGTRVLRQFGEFRWQVPILAGVYGTGLWLQDEKLHEFSKALISAYAITSLTTVAIKGITDTHRPTDEFQDGRYGFPSFHTASTFAIASVIDEYYGWPAGAPAYVVAGLVGWSRLDQREHDLSDVFFGSVLGLVIGKTIAAAHLDRAGDFQLYPYYDPVDRALGAIISTRF